MTPKTPVSESPSFLTHGAIRGEVLLPDEPSRLMGRDIDRLLVWATSVGASDVTIKSSDQLFLEIHGRKYRATRRRITNAEVLELIVHMFGNESPKAKLSGKEDIDFAYDLRPEKGVRYRFRVNATPINAEGASGVEITIRTIPSKPPQLSSLHLEPQLLSSMAPRQGMVVVAGGTGSGKSTLLAAIIRNLAEDPDGHRKILTYESPIEYVYDEVDKPTTSIAQSEIGKHLSSYAEGTRNALRRKPDIILVGEARDAESIGEAVTASMTGHCLYTTVHANGFADTIRRMVNVFPDGEKNARAVDIISSLRLVIAQRLVPSVDGRRVALREFVVMNDEIADTILDGGVGLITATCRTVLTRHGQSFLQDAKIKLAEGRITERVYAEVARGARGADRDATVEIEKTFQRIEPVRSSSSRRIAGMADLADLGDLVGPVLDFGASAVRPRSGENE